MQSNKLLKFDLDAREKILGGVNILSNAVKVTMGPRGRNVIIEQPGEFPILTKDGVTVARSINLKDQFSNLGVQVIKEAASRTADVAGDGTTTATILSQAIFAEGIKMLAAGFSAIDLKRGIEYAVDETINHLKKMAIPVTNDQEIKQVGIISANGEEEIGNLLLSAIQSVGQDGIVTVEEAKGFSTSLNIVDGSQIDRGYLSPYFITNQDRMTCEFSNPYILICNKKISSLKDLMPVLEKVLSSDSSLLIISDDVDGDAMQGLVLNRLKASLKVCVIKAPGFGESRVSLLGDLSALLGCEVLSGAAASDLKALELEDLGRCKKVIISKMDTVFVGSDGDKSVIEERINSIKCQLDEPSASFDRNEESLLRLRLSRLSGGVAVLHVGGATEGELKERKDRVEDALNATRAAIEEGIIPGGGVSLVRASNKVVIPKELSMTGFEAGINIVKSACSSPLKQIVENSGGTADVVLDRVLSLKSSHGYDAYLDKYGDMFKMGIIDPLKVVRCALENSASAAGILLTIGCAIIEDNKEDQYIQR